MAIVLTTGAPTADTPADDNVSAKTALACLFRLVAQNGGYAEIGAVRRRNLTEGDTLPASRTGPPFAQPEERLLCRASARAR